MTVINVLHITAHLGGGIGRVLSCIVEEFSRSCPEIRHRIVLLEHPEKSLFVERAKPFCEQLLVAPSDEELNKSIVEADVVQLHWWHHPAVARWMNTSQLPPMRLIIWSHISGLYVPYLRPDFVGLPERFLFSSPCSWENPDLISLDESTKKRIDTVFSSGGSDDFSSPKKRKPGENLRIGYVGTLNFAKLHPRILDFLAVANNPDFKITFVGDAAEGKKLVDEANKRGLSELIDLKGYSLNVTDELAQFDVFAYLLNPLHYGTTENALLEAMAMGVVPIVLDNPAERHLVQHGETGIVVRNPHEFAKALDFLQNHPEELQRLSRAASCTVRERFSLEKTASGLLKHYREVAEREKRLYDFRPIFGETPADWFRACLGPESWRFHDDGTVNLEGKPPEILMECNKASVFQYQRNFPDSPLLAAWREDIEEKLANRSNIIRGGENA